MTIQTSARHFVCASLGLLSVSVTTAAASDRHEWKASYDKFCRPSGPLERNMNAVKNAPSRVPLAHRGLYSRPLPGDTKYAAENTILAFQHAQCRGFIGIEVDIKHTKDGVAVLGHDKNYMRFNNLDGNGGDFYAYQNATIRTWNGTEFSKTRDFGANPATLISEMSYVADIRNKLTEHKTYDDKGHKREKRLTVNSDELRFEYALNLAKTNPHLKNLVWVLDIQTYRDLELSMEVVHRLDAWDRVIFKVWIDQLPMIYDPASPVPLADVVLPRENGLFVFAINGRNAKASSLYSLDFTVLDIENKTELKLPDWIAIDSFNQFQDEASASGKDNFALLGYEFLINGANPTDLTDILLEKLLRNEWFLFDRWRGSRWGVWRLADYQQDGTEIAISPQFPDGNYNGTGTPPVPGGSGSQYDRLPQTMVDARQEVSAFARIITEDIRRPSLRRSANSPLSLTGSMMALGF